MKDDRHIIWSNYNLDYKDWKDDLEAEYPDMTEDERKELMVYVNENHLNDVRVNLKVQLSRPILRVADIGRWDWRYSGYSEIDSGNIADCLYSGMDYATWYVDKLGDMRCDAVHHDGTNYYLYRTYKDNVTEEQIDRLKEKIYNGAATRADITRITRRIGDEIAKVYGFSIPRQQQRTMER
ncbi:MAG: hypothetical protein RR415_11725 [Ruthenibacterium sp.]